MAPVGAAFQKEFTAIVNIINEATVALANFLGLGTKGAIEKTQRELDAAFEKQRKFVAIERRNQKIGLPFDNTYLKSAADEIDRLQKKLSKLKGGTAPPVTKPVSTEDPNDPKGSGSKSGPRDTVAQTQAAIALQSELLRIEQQRFGLTEQELQLRDFAFQKDQAKAEYEEKLALIKTKNITAESKIAESKLAQLEYATDLQQIDNAREQAAMAATTAFEESETALLKAIDLEKAITDEQKRQVELQYALAEIEDSDLNPERKNRLKELTNELSALQNQNANPLTQYMNQLQEELSNTDAMFVTLAQTVESELGNAMSNAITGLIDGTQTAEDVFADMFKNIAKSFISMATQIIAKQLVMIALQSLLKALGAPTGGTGGMSSGSAERTQPCGD